MAGIVLIIPIVDGKVEAWRRFCQEMLGSRKEAHDESRRRNGIIREHLGLIERTYDSLAVTTFEADDLGQALASLLTSDLPFDQWYREQLQMLYGVDLGSYKRFSQRPPEAEDQETHFEWALPAANRNGTERTPQN